MTERKNSGNRENHLRIDIELGMTEIRKRKGDEKEEELLLPGSPSYSAGKHRQSIPETRGGFCMKIVKICIVVPLLISGLLAVVYFVVPCPIDPQPFSLPERPELVGPLEPNDILTKAERFMVGEVIGAESIVLHQDKMFSGTHDGKIIRIDRRTLEESMMLGKEPCGTFETEPTCGRPLGIRMNEKNELLVADAYLGLFAVNMWTNSTELLVKGGTEVQGRPLRFINDVMMIPTGEILFTDSSSKWDRRHYLNLFLEAYPDGRLLSFNPTTKEIHVLVDGLYFANGIELTVDKQAVLVTETTMARIHRYYIDGPNRGKIEVFAQNLPGYPDNIRVSSDGNIWVPMAFTRFKGAFSAHDFGSDKPWIRKLISQVLPIKVFEKIVGMFPKHGLVVQLDQNGNIVKSLHDPTGSIPSVSEVADAGKILFLGSYHSPFIAKVEL